MKPPDAPPSAFPKVLVKNVYAVGYALRCGGAATVGAKKAGGVGIVHHDERVVAVGQLADVAQRSAVPLHAEHAVGGDQAEACFRLPPSSLAAKSAMSLCW